jgi:O-acetyl-ADP-ribose deacetylase (regulator of RNase III)
MCQHLQSGQRPTDKIDAVAQDIADQLSEMNLGVGVPSFIRLDGISSSIEKSCVILACEQHVPGMVHTVSFQRERRTATVKFKTKQATREVAEKDSLTINGRRIGITLEEDPMENKIRRCSPEKTVLVSEIPPANVVSQQHFELYISNLLRGTGNILDLCQRNDSKALVVFTSRCAGEVVQRLGNPHTHHLVDNNNRPYKIQGEQLPPPDGVFVKNIITEGLRSFDSITRYFNNEQRSGGKGVKSVFFGPNRSRIVFFKDSETVNSVMVRDHSEMLGEEVEVYRFCSQLAEWTKGAPCRVELIRGTLETCKTEAYVNSPPSNLCLDNGPIARSLRDVGGPSFVDACNRYVREKGDIGVGCVGTTVGGNLQCKHVIHAVGMQYKGRDSERSMGQLVQKVLDECERLQVQSVAIPPLGAGTLKFPNSHDIIVRSLNTFLSSGACRSLKKIVLVDCEDLHNFRKSLERLM